VKSRSDSWICSVNVDVKHIYAQAPYSFSEATIKIYEADRLNNYIFITERYGKYKGSYASVICMADKILFVGRRR
jgi:hypothetical protein